VCFDIAYISEYSSRKGTASALLKDDVDNEIKEKRKAYLNDEILASSARENNKRLVGTKQVVLIESMDKSGRLRGRTSGFKQVRVEGGRKEDIGEFVEVEISECTSWALEGILFRL
jgi:tRNA-2-methylthio-N6-dimethylallyladenosine synthase